jgi:hypothetical protein
MERDSDLGQRKVVELDRGLFLVHYKSAGDEAAPKVVVAAAPGHEERLQIFTHPDSDSHTLWEPNTSLVVQATEPATLQVEVIPAYPNGSRVAAVRIEPVRQGQPRLQVSVDESTESAIDRAIDEITPNVGDIRILGHVAGIGDVIVIPNQWVAGPSAPSRIEGIAIEWPRRPSGIELRYAVKSGAAQIPSGNLVGPGEFAGTRGRALPLTGIILELSGELSDKYQLSAEAIFLNSPVMRVLGKRVTLSGPTGREPVVGLRLNVEPIEQRAPVQATFREAPARSAAPAPVAKPPAASRVRVFRSRANQDAS